MDKILNRISSIEHHPIAQLDKTIRIKYTRGLGSCLYALSSNSPITQMLFVAWAKSILNDSSNPLEFWGNNVKSAQSSVSIQRKGFSFFSMKYAFFFDVFYLLQYSFLPKYNVEEVYKYLMENVCGFFSKSALDKVYKYWVGTDIIPEKVDPSLIKHREINDAIVNAREKRVLVVANVSAGKSTLINSLVGFRFNKTKTTACTDKLVYIHNKCFKDGLTIKYNNGTYKYFDSMNEANSETSVEASFPFNSSLKKYNICFIDTPGFNNSDESTHRIITQDAIKKGYYDLVLYVSNCRYFGTNDEHTVLKYLKDNVKKPIVFVLNQIDCFVPEEDSVPKMLSDYRTDLIKIGFDNPIIIPVSAYTSLLLRIDRTLLSKIETFKLDTMSSLFSDDFYDLPTYIGYKKSDDMLSKTGIKILEENIIKN